MCVLSKADLLRYLEAKPPLVQDMIDSSVQVGENGIDLSVGKIEKFTGYGMLGFGKDDRKEPTTEEINVDKSVHLSKGAYRITYNEYVNIPKDLIAIARPRSTMLRYGATVSTALWDAGYEGQGKSLLTVQNEAGLVLQKNARIVQLVFLRLAKPVETGYTGTYLGEKNREISS